MTNVLERIQQAQMAMNNIGPHKDADDQLKAVKKVLDLVLAELLDLRMKVTPPGK